MGGGPEQTLIPRRHRNDQQIYERMLNFISYQGYANHNYDEIPPDIFRMAIIVKRSNNKC